MALLLHCGQIRSASAKYSLMPTTDTRISESSASHDVGGWAIGALGLCYGAFAFVERSFTFRLTLWSATYWIRSAPIDLAAAVILVALGTRRIAHSRRFAASARQLSAGERGALAGFFFGCAAGLALFWRTPLNTLLVGWTVFGPLGLVLGAIVAAWGSRLWKESHPPMLRDRA